MSLSFDGDAIAWRHQDARLEVELHRAPLNEIGTTALRELEILARYVKSGAGGAKVLILWSSRPGFCAGADLRELHAGLVARRQGRLRALLPSVIARRLLRFEVGRFLARIHWVLDVLDAAPMATIAAVHGVCFGGGFELALACDRIVADRTARFCFPELRLGLVPGFGGIPRLERDVGNAMVRDLLLTGRSIGAKRAHEVGLVAEMVGRGNVLEAARRSAEQLARFEPQTMAAAKRFAKPIPKARMERERRVFAKLVTRPEVMQSLGTFVDDEGVRPYLPPPAGGVA